MIGYIARDKQNNSLCFHCFEPIRDIENEWWWSDDNYMQLTEDFEDFKSITWEDEPVKVELNIKRI